jgi:hypothetical protein
VLNPLVVALVLLSLTLAGVVITLIALFPRRTGSTPYCRKCGYNLTGRALDDPDARCSECGVALSQDAVVRGKRHVRRGRLAVGLLLFLIGAVPLVGAGVALLRGADVYQYLPSRVLLAFLRYGNVSTVDEATAELRIRIAGNKLSASTTQALIELCLDEQARPEVREEITAKVINLLGIPRIASAIGASQKERMYTNMVRDVRIRTRARILSGDEFPLYEEFHFRVPDAYESSCMPSAIRCNGEELRSASGTGSSGAGSFGLVAYSCAPATVAGPGPLEVDFEIVIHPVGNEDLVLHRRNMIRRAPMVVLPRSSPDPIRRIRTEELDALIPTIVWAEPIEIRRSPAHGTDFSVDGLISVSAPNPCGLAFEVVAQYGGRTIPLGLVSYPRAESGQFGHALSAGIDGAPPERIDLLLRSSRAAAAQTLDMYEIRGGALRITDVRVVREGDYTTERPKFRARLEE